MKQAYRHTPLGAADPSADDDDGHPSFQARNPSFRSAALNPIIFFQTYLSLADSKVLISLVSRANPRFILLST
jgi:hypothetical protein